MITDKSNFSIRYLDPTPYIQGCSFYIRGHFSIETYFRLCIAGIASWISKNTVSDSDMVVQGDVAELYNENIDGYLLGACHDADTAGGCITVMNQIKTVYGSGFEIKRAIYVFSGRNFAYESGRVSEDIYGGRKLQYATSHKFQLLDQDILNKLCEGKVRYLDMVWNMMVDYAGIRKNQIVVKVTSMAE